MANPAGKGQSNKGGKVTPFKKSGNVGGNVVVANNKSKLANIKQLASAKPPKPGKPVVASNKGKGSKLAVIKQWAKGDGKYT